MVSSLHGWCCSLQSQSPPFMVDDALYNSWCPVSSRKLVVEAPVHWILQVFEWRERSEFALSITCPKDGSSCIVCPAVSEGHYTKATAAPHLFPEVLWTVALILDQQLWVFNETLLGVRPSPEVLVHIYSHTALYAILEVKCLQILRISSTAQRNQSLSKSTISSV